MHTRTIFISIVAATLAFACKKDSLSSVADPPIALSVRQLIDQERMAGEQEFTIDPTSDGAVIADGGVIVTWSSYSFRDHTGDFVTAPVVLKILESLTPSSMVRFNMQTVGNGPNGKEALQSGGAIRVRMESQGEQVTVADNGVYFHFPAVLLDPLMERYVGDEDEEGDVLWVADGPLVGDTMGVTITDSTGATIWYPGNFYTFESPNLPPNDPTWPQYGFFNCDHPLFTGTDSTDVTVLLPAAYQGNTMVWIVLPDQASMIYLETNVPGGGKRAGFGVQIGLSGTIVAFHAENGQYASAFVPITIADDHVQEIQLAPTSMAQYQADLLGL